MQITAQHRQRFTITFLVIFYILAIYKLLNGLWLFQAAPYFFINRFDGTTWLLMQTGIHQWLLNNRTGWILFDVAFYVMPLTWYLAYKSHEGAGTIAAILWLIVNWVYVQCYTLYPINSIESHIAWLLIPLLFATTRLKSFYFVMHGLRYFFLFFFASAGIWKLRQGGIFYPEQMSGILLMQHADYLVSAPGTIFTKYIYWLVKHPAIGQALYVGATLLELFFIIGFFSRKYDKWLMAGFGLFLLSDQLLMRIPYFEVLPLALPLFFSKYKEPVNEVNLT
ncbi:MAG: hypothetical protein V4717_05125 [Bacteroidota bacterium]